MESVLVKPKEPEDGRHFRLQKTFPETCFVFPASVLTNLSHRTSGLGSRGEPGPGRGEEACPRPGLRFRGAEQ